MGLWTAWGHPRGPLPTQEASAWLRGQPLAMSPLRAAGLGVFSTAAWTALWPRPGQPQPRPRQGQLLWGSGPGPSKGNCIRGTQATPHPPPTPVKGRAGQVGRGGSQKPLLTALGVCRASRRTSWPEQGPPAFHLPCLPWCLAWNVCLVSSYERLERRAEADQGGVENLSEKVTLLFLPLLL